MQEEKLARGSCSRRAPTRRLGWLPVVTAGVAIALASSLPLARAQEKPEGEKSPSKEQPQGPEVEIAKQIVAFLKDELDLSTEQVGKVQGVIQDAMKEALRSMLKYSGGEEAPSQEEIDKQRKEMQERFATKIREVLDDPQKKQFDALVKEFETRSGRWQGGGDRPGGDAAAWLEGELPSKDVLIARAEKALILSEDERKVLLPVLEKAVEARIALRSAINRRKTDLGHAVHGGAKEDEVKERLHEIRRKQDELERTLESAEEALRELVTVDQEARLVAIGILD